MNHLSREEIKQVLENHLSKSDDFPSDVNLIKFESVKVPAPVEKVMHQL